MCWRGGAFIWPHYLAGSSQTETGLGTGRPWVPEGESEAKREGRESEEAGGLGLAGHKAGGWDPRGALRS